ACGLPWYGTCTSLTPARCDNSSAARGGAGPAQWDAYSPWPGFELASAMSSCTLRMPSEGCTTRTTAPVFTSAMGAKSRAMSNDRLGLMAWLVMLADEPRNSV